MDTLLNIKKVLADVSKRLQRIEEKLGQQQVAKSEWLDHQEICRRLNISKRTLDNYREQGLLPFSKIGGKVYFRPGDIDEFLATHVTRRRRK